MKTSCIFVLHTNDEINEHVHEEEPWWSSDVDGLLINYVIFGFYHIVLLVEVLCCPFFCFFTNHMLSICCVFWNHMFPFEGTRLQVYHVQLSVSHVQFEGLLCPLKGWRFTMSIWGEILVVNYVICHYIICKSFGVNLSHVVILSIFVNLNHVSILVSPKF